MRIQICILWFKGLNGVLLLDLTKALDTVEPELLLQTLKL